MDVFEAITGRASIRAFLKKPMPRELIHKILDVSRWAPSGVNPSSTVQKVKGLIYADSGLIFAVSLHYILDDFGAGGQF